MFGFATEPLTKIWARVRLRGAGEKINFDKELPDRGM